MLAVPLIAMLGMMVFGGTMMAQMGVMHTAAANIALCGLWAALAAAALIWLIVLWTRDPGGHERTLPSLDAPAPLPR